MVLPPDTLQTLLATWPSATLATVSPTSTPHCVPIVFCAHRGVVYSPLDGKRKRTTRLQRFENLASNPRASLLLDHYADDWQALWWVRIDGAADWHAPDAGTAHAIAEALRRKYPQYRDSGLGFDASAYLRLVPERVTAWAQSGSPEAILAACRLPAAQLRAT